MTYQAYFNEFIKVYKTIQVAKHKSPPPPNKKMVKNLSYISIYL